MQAIHLRIGCPVKLPTGRMAFVTALSRHTVELLYEDGAGLVELTRAALSRML